MDKNLAQKANDIIKNMTVSERMVLFAKTNQIFKQRKQKWVNRKK